MKRFFTKTGIWLLAAAAIIAVVLCVVSSLSSGTGLLHNALGVIASPFRSAGAAVTEWVGGIGDRFENVEALQQENEELRQQIAELEKQLRAAEPAAEENVQLRSLLGLRQQRSDLQFEAARVTQRDVSNWASTLVLDRGSRHDVAVGDCAVDSTGALAGVVTEVGLNWCRLSTILDTDSQFGAKVFRTGETAVAGGDPDERGAAAPAISDGQHEPHPGGRGGHVRIGRVLPRRAGDRHGGRCADRRRRAGAVRGAGAQV